MPRLLAGQCAEAVDAPERANRGPDEPLSPAVGGSSVAEEAAVSRPRLLDLFCGASGAAMGYIELAWAAGFFDGEGSVSPHIDKRPGRNPGLQIDIEQTDERPLIRFQKAVGQGGRRTLCKPRVPTRKPLWRLHYGHAASFDTLIVLWPYLSEPKREQAMAAFRTIGWME